MKPAALLSCFIAAISLLPIPARSDEPAPSNPNANKTFATFREMLQGMPDDTIPTVNGWDKFTFPRARKWISDNVVGAAYIGSPKLLAVHSQRNPKSKSDADAWVVTISIDNLPGFKFRGVEIHPSVGRPIYGVSPTFEIIADETRVKHLEKLPKGKPLKLEGKIALAILDNQGEKKAVYLRIGLDDSTLTGLD